MKFCVKCGNSLEDSANTCELCGEIQPYFSSNTDSDSRTDNNRQSQNTSAYYTDTDRNNQNYSTYNPNVYTNSTPYNSAVYKRSNGFCIAGFVLSIVSWFIPFLCIVGLVLSIIGVHKFNPDTETGKGFGIAGIIINAVDIFFTALLIIIFITLIIASI